jgi:hypothetical protein
MLFSVIPYDKRVRRHGGTGLNFELSKNVILRFQSSISGYALEAGVQQCAAIGPVKPMQKEEHRAHDSK